MPEAAGGVVKEGRSNSFLDGILKCRKSRSTLSTANRSTLRIKHSSAQRKSAGPIRIRMLRYMTTHDESELLSGR